MTTRFDIFITIDGSGFDSGYEQSVLTYLHFISTTESGKVLLDSMRATGKQITIVPYVPSAFSPDFANAYMTRKGGLKIHFTPDLFWNSGFCRKLGGMTSPGFRPSEVLFHEMVHTYREGMKGVIYSESSELAVIAVSNIYISETRGPGEPLRRDHSDNSPPLDEQSFISSNQDFIRSVKASDPIFFKKLGDVSAAFNPFFESTVTLTMGTPKIFQTHVVKAGDTLSDLAAKYYGAREYWPLIWDANRGAVPNPNLIEPGHPLRIAPLESLGPAELEEAKRRHASWKKHPHGPKAKVPVAPIR